MIHVVNGSGLSLEQSAIHNASLQVCVLRGILGLDQSNTDLLANICLLGTLAGGEHTQSLLDCISGIGVAVDVLLTDDLAGDLLNSIVQSDLVGGVSSDDSLDSFRVFSAVLSMSLSCSTLTPILVRASAMSLLLTLAPQPVRTDSARTPARATARNFFAIFMIFASIIMNDLTGRLSSSGRRPVGLIIPPPPELSIYSLHFYHIIEL